MSKIGHLGTQRQLMIVSILAMTMFILARPSDAEANCWYEGPWWARVKVCDYEGASGTPIEDVQREIDNCINGGGCSLPADEVWGEAGRELYLDGAALIATKNAMLPRKRLDAFQKAYLRPQFGNLVDKIYVKYGATTLDNWRLGIVRMSQPSAGQTFCNNIYITQRYRPNDFDLLVLLAHELYHSKQCEDLGGLSNFGYWYFKEYKRANQNYAKNRMEVTAASFENQFLTRSVGRKIYFRNKCWRNIRVALRYYEPGTASSSGKWATKYWWTIPAGKVKRLVSGGSSIRTTARTLYYHATIPGESYSWNGNGKNLRTVSGQELSFRDVYLPTNDKGGYEIKVNCSNFRPSTSTPQPTPTRRPTATPTSNPSTSPTADDLVEDTRDNCLIAYKFIKDVTIPDGTRLSPGETFVKVWRYRNTGTCTWDKDYTLKYYYGPRMSSPTSVAFPEIVRPGELVDIAISLVAPTTPGEYKTKWRLQAAGGTDFPAFGRPFIEIIVE